MDTVVLMVGSLAGMVFGVFVFTVLCIPLFVGVPVATHNWLHGSVTLGAIGGFALAALRGFVLSLVPLAIVKGFVPPQGLGLEFQSAFLVYGASFGFLLAVGLAVLSEKRRQDVKAYLETRLARYLIAKDWQRYREEELQATAPELAKGEKTDGMRDVMILRGAISDALNNTAPRPEKQLGDEGQDSERPDSEIDDIMDALRTPEVREGIMLSEYSNFSFRSIALLPRHVADHALLFGYKKAELKALFRRLIEEAEDEEDRQGLVVGYLGLSRFQEGVRRCEPMEFTEMEKGVHKMIWADEDLKLRDYLVKNNWVSDNVTWLERSEEEETVLAQDISEWNVSVV
ncbi:MAG: hypothetical protein IID51_08010 [Proteobacteria bacterium]|nr:hypothetical protein [Pseudomonadota bacterium]